MNRSILAFRWKMILIAAALCGLAALRLEAASVYFIGNSVTDGLKYSGLQALAQSRGFNHPWGRHMIPGSTLDWIWANPTSGFGEPPYGYYNQALPNHDWNFVSLQPFDRLLNEDITNASRFIDLARTRAYNNGNTRFLIHGRYPRQDDPWRPGGVRDYDTLWNRAYTGGFDGTNETRDFFNRLVDGLRGQYSSMGGHRILLVPVGDVFYEINQRMKSGLIPGYSNVYQLYNDGIHVSNVGSYVLALTYHAVVYQQSPVELPVPAAYASTGVANDRPIGSDLAWALQLAVWDAVRNNPRSGVVSGPLEITTASFPAGRQGRPYSASTSATGGTAPRTFSIASGVLPPGLTLSAAGDVTGTPSNLGAFNFRLRVRDSAGATAERDFSITVTANSVPSISTGSSLPAGHLGSRYNQSLAATGGDQPLSWQLVSGSLPPGVLLGGGGQLVGVPTAQGSYSFRVRVSDADSPADTAEKDFTLGIGAPEAITVFPKKLTSPITLDGVANEAAWTLPHTANRGALGTPNNSATWQALWDAEYFYVAVKVMDGQIIRNSATPSVNDDTVDVFLDSFNDKEVFMNVQHRHFRISTNGTHAEVVGGRNAGVIAAAAAITGGYSVEIAIPWSNISLNAGPNTPLGIDVGVNDNDGGSARSAFQRFAYAAASNPKPSEFGNALLSAETVGGGGTLANLSRGKTATASSNEAGNTPALAVDGNTTSRWAASSGSFPQWWEVDLGQASTLSSIALNFEGASKWKYRVEARATSSDPWTVLIDQNGNTASSQIFNHSVLTGGANKRHVRITLTGYDGGFFWASLREVDVMGTSGGTSGGGTPGGGTPGGGSPGHPGAGQGTGTITRDLWTGIPGTAIADIPLTTPPSSSGTLASLEAPSNAGDSYGQRLEGFLHPSATGAYTFWIAGDDSVELWLSTNDQPSSAQRIAYHNAWTSAREWNKYATQKSAAINLTAGQKYSIRVLMKEGGGGDNLAVSWRLNSTNPDNGSAEFIIPGTALSPRSGGSSGGGTPPPPEGGTTNLALNKPATASSTESGKTLAMANDGSTGSRWAAANGNFPHWWEVDLGSAQNVASSEIVFEGSSAWKYRIEGRATTGDAWTTLLDRTGNTSTAQTYADTLANGSNKRYIRVTLTGYNGGYFWASMWECRIFGSASTGGSGGSGQEAAAEAVDPPAAKSSDLHRVFAESTASGGSCAVLEANAIGDFVTYAIPNVQAGTYTIQVRMKRSTNRAVFQTATSDSLGGTYTNRGSTLDGYNTAMDYVEVPAGTVTFGSAGTKYIRFTATGKQAASSGYWMAIDRIRLVP